MARRLRRLLCAAGLLLLAGCAEPLLPAPPALPALPASQHLQAGSIWSTREARFITYEALLARTERADVIFLGEIHDNQRHHRDQLKLLSDLIADGRHPAVAMEQFDIGTQSALDQARRMHPADALQIGQAGRFDSRGWQWDFYQPIIQQALRADLPLVAANLSARDARAVVNGGLDTLGRARRADLGLDAPLSSLAQAELEQSIEEGHCGALPAPAVARMADAQRARDAALADAVLPWVSHGVVVIAGRGHARRDFGAPFYLTARNPRLEVAAVGLTELDPAHDSPAEYVESTPAGSPRQPVFDFLWFEAPAVRDDPCRMFRTQTPSQAG